MKRVTLLVNMGRHKAGYGIEVDDATANMWQATGKAIIGPPDQALKKGNLQNYNNCQPLTHAELAAKSKTVTAPPKPVAVVAEETTTTHKNT